MPDKVILSSSIYFKGKRFTLSGYKVQGKQGYEESGWNALVVVRGLG